MKKLTDLKVSHYPQIPCKPFEVFVNNEQEAFLIENVLANQHLFLFNNKFIPDYSNVITVEKRNDDSEWEDYYNDELGMDWDEYKEANFK